MNPVFKTIVITGASGGIGGALAESYAKPGITMGLLGRDVSRLENISIKCREKGASVYTASIDIRDQETLAEWLYGFDDSNNIDLLIASAGITYPISRAMLHEPPEELINIMNVNFSGTINSLNPVIDRMRERGMGHIAVLSSLSAYHGIPGFPAYSASKAALLNYLQGIRGRLAGAGIILTVICPGYIQTSMTAKLPGIKMMIMPVEKAAGIIKRGLERQKPLIAFPLLLRLGLWFLNILPIRMSTYILNKLFGIKKREE